MQYTNKDIRRLSGEDLRGNWFRVILLYIVVGLISYLVNKVLDLVGLGSDIGSLLSIGLLGESASVNMVSILLNVILTALISSFVSSIFNLGIDYGFLDLVDGGRIEFSDLLGAFRQNPIRNFLAVIVRNLLSSLGRILFYIPGIIIDLMLMALPYVLKENPEMTTSQTLAKSKNLMKGHKMSVFLLTLPYNVSVFLIAFVIIWGLLDLIASNADGFIALGLNAVIIGIVVVFVLIYWLDIKTRAVYAGYYRRILAPSDK